MMSSEHALDHDILPFYEPDILMGSGGVVSKVASSVFARANFSFQCLKQSWKQEVLIKNFRING